MTRRRSSRRSTSDNGALRKFLTPIVGEPEAGAFVVLVAACMILLMGLAALALDGGRMYDERRTAQNAADHASLAAAWAYCETVDPIAAGLASAASNGYENDGIDDFVTVTDLGGGEFEAHVTSVLDTTFARVFSADQVDVTARAVGYCGIDDSLGGYAMFASGDCAPTELSLTGSQQVIDGGVHSNSRLRIIGSNDPTKPSIILGPVTYVDSINVSGVIDDYLPWGVEIVGEQVEDPLPLPGRYNIDNYAPGGKYAPGVGPESVAAAYYHYSSTDASYAGIMEDGLYFVEGDLELSAVQASKATFVATGQISLIGNVNTLSEPYMANGLGIFSDYLQAGSDKCNETAIKWAGSDNDWSGVQYAPNGAVDMSAADNSSFNGSILAYNMTLAGSSFNLVYDDSFKAEPATTIQLQE